MGTFPEFDPEHDVIRLNGGREIMLALLCKAKFGERFDPETLLHPSLAELLRDLQPSQSASLNEGTPFPPEDLHSIGTAIYYESARSGWWAMSLTEREAYVADAVAPWVLPASDIEAVLESVDGLRSLNSRIVATAHTAHSI